MTLLLLYLLLSIGFSFLCSILEAALLSVPRSHVAVMTDRGSKAGELLRAMKDDIDRPLAAILTLNTFAHTLGAAGVGAQATAIWGEAWIGVVGVVVTVLILIFSEIIPKTLGAVHAKGLASFTAWTTHVLIIVLSPIVAVCNWISRLVSGSNQPAPMISRDEVHIFASLAHEEGAIDHNEARIMRNLVALRDTSAEDVMTPRTVVFALRADQTVGEVTANEPPRFARAPVIGESLDDVRGVVHRHDLFMAGSQERAGDTLARIARPVHHVPESANLADLLHQFIERREHLFMVVDEYGGTAGIVTLEDVLETLLGVEIVDETDGVKDMQKLARQLVARRRSGKARSSDRAANPTPEQG
jgi:CBS domain containing-hemolysin-like protein